MNLFHTMAIKQKVRKIGVLMFIIIMTIAFFLSSNYTNLDEVHLYQKKIATYWKNVDASTMTLDQVKEYVHWQNETSCNISQVYGGVGG